MGLRSWPLSAPLNPSALSSPGGPPSGLRSSMRLPFLGCQAKLHFCDSNPCKNSGSCSERWGGFSCDCPVGFGGKDCRLSEWERGPGGACRVSALPEVGPVTLLLLSPQPWPIPTISVATAR